MAPVVGGDPVLRPQVDADAARHRLLADRLVHRAADMALGLGFRRRLFESADPAHGAVMGEQPVAVDIAL